MRVRARRDIGDENAVAGEQRSVDVAAGKNALFVQGKLTGGNDEFI